MTSGERMVWAAEFVRRRALGCTAPESVCWAARAVEAMRSVVGSTQLDAPAYRMWEAMISIDGEP